MQRLNIKDLRIILVEPSSAQIKMITSKLNEGGVSHIEAYQTIGEALETLQTYVPDLIISAMYFSDGTGVEFINKIRQNSSLEAVPFLLVSSEDRFEVLDPIKQAGVVAILPKPFDAQDLTRALVSTLDFLDSSELKLKHFAIEDVRILVVDDSNMARKHIMRVLSSLGACHIDQAVDGQNAIEQLLKEHYDLVVTDYNMPNMDGGELLKSIKSHPHLSHTPVIMVTSEQDNATLRNVQQAGVSALCDKPFDTTYVKELLGKLL